MKNKTEHIYVIDIDCMLDRRLKTFQEQLGEEEQIMSQVVAGSKLVITTRRPPPSPAQRKNLLLEEIKKEGPQ